MGKKVGSEPSCHPFSSIPGSLWGPKEIYGIILRSTIQDTSAEQLTIIKAPELDTECAVRSPGLIRQPWAPFLAPQLINVTLDRSPDLSRPQVPLLKNRIIK